MSRKLMRWVKALVPQAVRNAAKTRLRRRYYQPAPIPAGSGIFPRPDGSLDVALGAVRIQAPPGADADAAAIVSDRNGAEELKDILAEARAGACLLDIGAHRGMIGAFFCAAHPEARAICFEPSPPLADEVRALAARNGFTPRMTVRQAAIGEQEGKQKMLFDPAGGYVQTKRYEHSMWSEPREIELAIDTVDAFCAREGVRPTVIKFDIEAYELEGLRGARRTLAAARPVVSVELHLNYLEERGVAPLEVLQPLVEHGYRFFLLDGRPTDPTTLCECPLDRVHFVARPPAG